MIAKEISRGITHIEDLPLTEFIETLTKLQDFEFTEKVDGAQLLFGLDENGFYTSRETKGGQRMYSVESYNKEFSTTYMRSAHLALESVLPLMKGAGLRPGDQVEVEVLYGELPNVVPYSKDRNYLIFLRTTEGDVNIDRLTEELSGQFLSIALESPLTEDGRNVIFRESKDFWLFDRVPRLDCYPLWKSRRTIMNAAEDLMTYLREESGISGQSNFSIGTTLLNKRPEWCPPEEWKFTKVLVKEKKEEILKNSYEVYIPKIKEVLLEYYVRNTASAYGPPKSEGGWIEGIVMKDPRTGRMVKLIDKDVFGRIRETAWQKRNQLTEHAKSVDNLPSFMAEVYVGMATAIGHPELGTMQAKPFLRKLGSTNEERLQRLSENINFRSVKEYWLNFLDAKRAQLLVDLDKYEKEAIRHLNEGVLQRAIHERTMQTFSTVFHKIGAFEERIREARTPEVLAKIIAEKHLREL